MVQNVAANLGGVRKIRGHRNLLGGHSGFRISRPSRKTQLIRLTRREGG